MENSIAILVRDENAEGYNSVNNKLSLINNVIETDDIKVTPTNDLSGFQWFYSHLDHVKGNLLSNSTIEIEHDGNTFQFVGDGDGNNSGKINDWNNFTSKEYSLNDGYLPDSNLEVDVIDIALSSGSNLAILGMN